MEINIQEIAQSVVDQLLADKKKIDGAIVGVNMLYERLVGKIEQLNRIAEEVKNVGRPEAEAGSESSGNAQEAQPASSEEQPDSGS